MCFLTTARALLHAYISSDNFPFIVKCPSAALKLFCGVLFEADAATVHRRRRVVLLQQEFSLSPSFTPINFELHSHSRSQVLVEDR